MKQVVQNYKTGKVSLLEVPVPQCSNKCILVRNGRSLISTGTERATIALGKKSLLGKARARPDLVKRAINKAKKEGLKKTFQEALGRLDTPTPLGYSAAGLVVEAGPAAHDFSPGDRVACIGQGMASHAEWIDVPVNMACRIPDNLSDDAAAFGMLGTIALHGIRKAKLSFGSTVVVIGLGLLGLLSIQILKAYGCRVFAMDLLPSKVDLAKQLGADFATTETSVLMHHINALTHAHGVDAVILTAASKSHEPVDIAIQLLRFGGKIVVVGTADIHPDRNEMWKKELELVVSKAGGPGALDPLYEQGGIDLPIAQVRWTQHRNLEEFLRLLSEKSVQVEPLISHRFSIDSAEEVYQDLLENKLSNVVGVLFEYHGQAILERRVSLPSYQAKKINNDAVNVSVIGAGVFGKALLLPTLEKRADVVLRTLVTSSGSSAEHSAKRFGFQFGSTDAYQVFADRGNNAIIALTPHHTHADFVIKALQQEKSLFIEKPLCTNPEELYEIQLMASAVDNVPIIMVGHNRRFSPHAIKMKSWLSQRQNPLVIQYRVNAGFVPADHWVHSDCDGRSRIVGEMSHFIDLMRFLTVEKPERVYAERITADNQSAVNNDNLVVTIKFSKGSVASLTYTASGNKSYSRELLEIFFDGKTICCQDYRKTTLYSSGRKEKFNTRSQAMGYAEELSHFIACVKGKLRPAVSMDEMFSTMEILFAIEASLAAGKAIVLTEIANAYITGY